MANRVNSYNYGVFKLVDAEQRLFELVEQGIESIEEGRSRRDAIAELNPNQDFVAVRFVDDVVRAVRIVERKTKSLGEAIGMLAVVPMDDPAPAPASPTPAEAPAAATEEEEEGEDAAPEPSDTAETTESADPLAGTEIAEPPKAAPPTAPTQNASSQGDKAQDQAFDSLFGSNAPVANKGAKASSGDETDASGTFF